MTNITIGSEFTILASGWNTNNGLYTFLQQSEGNFLTIDNKSVTSGLNLDPSFIFTFQRIGCCSASGTTTKCTSNTPLKYGDYIQLFNKTNNKFARCGGGTCSMEQSLNNDNCGTDDWTTFQILNWNSPTSYGGNVKYDDTLFLMQPGGKQSITAAGGTSVYTSNEKSNINSKLVLLPPDGYSSQKTPGLPAKKITGNCITDLRCHKATEEYGPVQDIARNPLCIGDKFTLYYKNWISTAGGSGSGLKAFSRTVENGNMETINNIMPTNAGLSIGTQFEYTFTKVNCNVPTKQINYGDVVQLYSPSTARYIQCGSGTCSGILRDSGMCDTNNWQTFKIESSNGKTGPVCWDDEIYITQIVSGASITPSGGAGTWAVKQGTNINSIIKILPVNGSIYKDSKLETEAYKQIQQSLLCKYNSWNLSCLLDKYKKYIIMIVLIILGLILLPLIIRLI